MKRRDSSTALRQEDILCATSCEIYIPVPNLELNQDGQMQHVKWSQQNLTLHGFCDIYLLKYASTSCRKSVLLDITDDCHKIELDITLNKILEEKLRYNKKTDTWYEFWSHVGERNYNTTIKLDKNDEEFLKFSEHLEQVLSTLEECQKKKTVVECTYKIVAFQAAKKSQENLNTFGRREKFVVQEKEFLDSIGLPPSQCGNIDRQTDNKIAREITEPPFSPKPFYHINTEFISQGINSNENNLEKSLYLKPKNNLSVKNVLTGLDHVPSAKSVVREIEEVNLVSSTSQYENMMDRDKSLGVATSPLQRLVELLQAAINSCDKENAAKHAESLAATGANVNISLNTSNIKKDPKDTEFSIDVHVEDREASGGHITLKVKPTDTVGDLKLRMCLKHNFPVEVQKWIIGKRIPPDKETLQKARVTQGQAVYLYLVSCKSVGLTREKFNEQKERMLQNQYPGMRQSNVRQGSVNLAESGDYIPMGTPGTPKTPHSILPPSRQRSEAPNSASPGLAPNSIPNIQPLLHQKSKENQGRTAKPKSHTPYVREQSLEGFEVVGPEHIVQNIPPQQNKSQTKTQIGWICPACTYINQPTRPGCEICATNRPVDYIVPDGYQMTKEEEERIRREQELEQQAQRATTERGPRENADEEYYGDLNDRDIAALLEVQENLNRDPGENRTRFPAENIQVPQRNAPPQLELNIPSEGNVPRVSLENLHFPLDNRQINWNEEHL